MSYYGQMVAIVKRERLCGAYRSDLTEHDRRCLARGRPGDEWLWFPYHDGTHLIALTVGAPALLRGTSASELVGTIRTIYQNFSGVQAYHIARDMVRRIDQDAAIELAREARITQEEVAA